MQRKILKYGHPALRKKAEPVGVIDKGIRALVRDMLATMASAEGVGLAAEQIGVTQAVCVIDVPADHDLNEDGERLNPEAPMPLVMINPEIRVIGKRRQAQPEGCLSFPGITAAVTRPYRIAADYIDLDGHRHTLEACDLVARAIQHEVDHLNGVLLVDRMSAVKKASLSGVLKRMRAENGIAAAAS